ncbi:MAG TPA: HAMP domain-containing sensor histidine kinase [Gemmatimonadaceae bacterium]|nr:HAMP domain-containing sensor histidine kinase [Gemmatimonadaceae bacterium]
MVLQTALAFSLGVHLLVFLSLGLTGVGSPQVRAYRWFVAATALWLVLALLVSANVATGFARPLAGAVAHALPIIFVLGGTLPRRPGGKALGIPVIAASALLLPFTIGVSPLHDGRVELLYYAGAWGLAGFGVFATMRSRIPANGRGRWIVVMALLVTGVVLIGLLVALNALAAIALVAALLQAVVLYATVRLSLYTVRQDASRTGALAAGVAEHDRRAVAGEIAAMVAHEVRNPLTGVRSLAQRLSDGDATEERRRRYADLIVREVDRVERMVSTLLGAAARRESSGERDTDLARLFDDVALLVSERYRRAGVALTVEGVNVHVAAPPEPLAQVLLNLLLNAAQQHPTVRHVRLRAERVTSGSTESVELRVEDDGAGVPVADRDSIFFPFHSGTGGSGLGLAVVRRLCEEWGWTIAVRDTPGGGATFALVVPSASAPAREEPVHGRPVSSGSDLP